MFNVVLAGVFQIKVTEGEVSRTFIISRAVLEQRAPNLSKHILGGKLLCSTFIELTDVSIATFDEFVRWLGSDEEERNQNCLYGLLNFIFNIAVPSISPWSLLLPTIETYRFGDSYDVPQLRKDALWRLSDCFRKTACNTPFDRDRAQSRPSGEDRSYALEAITLAYANTVHDSPLRRILVDGFCAAKFTLAVTGVWLEQFPKKFLADVLCRKARLQTHEESRRDALLCMRNWQDDGEDTGREKKRKRLDSGADA